LQAIRLAGCAAADLVEAFAEPGGGRGPVAEYARQVLHADATDDARIALDDECAGQHRQESDERQQVMHLQRGDQEGKSSDDTGGTPSYATQSVAVQ
jgi:hypothetical protein